METIITIFAFIYGACIGSFLNVCIVRMPEEKSVVRPGSHCPTCKQPIPWHFNIPLIGYLILRGRTHCCQERLSPRYFLVELITAITFVLYYKYYGVDWRLLPYLFMVSCFIVATFVDLKHRIIPDEISVGGMYFGLLFSFLIPTLHGFDISAIVLSSFWVQWVISFAVAFAFWIIILSIAKLITKLFSKDFVETHDVLLWNIILIYMAIKVGVYLLGQKEVWQPYDVTLEMTPYTIFYGLMASLFAPELSLRHVSFIHLESLGRSILGVVYGGGGIYMMGLIGDFIFRKESMGGGDVKLLAMMGAFLGWKLAILTFFIAPFFGALFGLVEKVRTGESAIAYGPFLVLGAIISQFYGEKIWQWIATGYGLY